MKPIFICLVTCILLMSCSKSDSVAEPKSYDDCVLKYLKSGMTKEAAIAVQRSCKKEFPDSVSVDSARDLTAEELKQITGTFKPSHNENQFWGHLYNGNRSLRVTKLEIQITYSQNGQDQTRNFFLTSEIGPISANDHVLLETSSEITQSNMKSWNLVSGRGKAGD